MWKMSSVVKNLRHQFQVVITTSWYLVKFHRMMWKMNMAVYIPKRMVQFALVGKSTKKSDVDVYKELKKVFETSKCNYALSAKTNDKKWNRPEKGHLNTSLNATFKNDIKKENLRKNNSNSLNGRSKRHLTSKNTLFDFYAQEG